MKYVVKFTNGYWKVFDTVQYDDVLMCNLKTEADFHCKRLASQDSSSKRLNAKG